jgi:hypothetical protein
MRPSTCNLSGRAQRGQGDALCRGQPASDRPICLVAERANSPHLELQAERSSAPATSRAKRRLLATPKLACTGGMHQCTSGGVPAQEATTTTGVVEVLRDGPGPGHVFVAAACGLPMGYGCVSSQSQTTASGSTRSNVSAEEHIGVCLSSCLVD